MSFFLLLKSVFTGEGYNYRVDRQCNPEVVDACLQEAKAYLEEKLPKKEASLPVVKESPNLDVGMFREGYCVSGNLYEDVEVKPAIPPANEKYILEVRRILKAIQEQTFVELLRYHINRKGLIGPEVYRAALIDKRLYSKIISDTNYKPTRETAIALAFALNLNLEEAKEFLSRTWYSLSETDRRDVILAYFFQQTEKVKLSEINAVLKALGELPIGRGRG